MQIDAETGEKNTFKQMRKRSVKCALWLQKRGIKSGDIITVCTRNQLEAYVPYLAALYIGAIMNPWPRRENGMKCKLIFFFEFKYCLFSQLYIYVFLFINTNICSICKILFDAGYSESNLC